MWTQQTHNLLHVSALVECHHQGVLVSATVMSFKLVHIMRHSHSLTKSFTRAHIRYQFEGHNSNRYKNSMMMALKSRRSRVYCVHIPVHVRLVWQTQLCIMHGTYNINILLFVYYRYLLEQWRTFTNTTPGQKRNLICNTCISLPRMFV